MAEPTVQDKAKLIVIQADKGKVRCSQFDTHLEGSASHAAPPVGDLRSRAPIEHAAWTDVRDATKFGPSAFRPRPSTMRRRSGGLPLSERRQPGRLRGSPLPVMVWINGGGFINGSGNAFYGADHSHGRRTPSWSLPIIARPIGSACASVACDRGRRSLHRQLRHA